MNSTFSKFLPPAFRRNREGTVFTDVCLSAPAGIPHLHHIMLPLTGPMFFLGGTPVSGPISFPGGGEPKSQTGGNPVPDGWVSPVSDGVGVPQSQMGWGTLVPGEQVPCWP